MRSTFAIGMTGSNLVNSLNANFLELYRGYARNAEDYGLSSSASAATNTAALQTALNGGNCSVLIRFGTGTGIFEVNDTLLVDSNTSIVCEPGVVLKKTASYAQVFLNRGALTKTYNENILIDGLEISVNGNDPDSTLVFGLRANMGFYYIKNSTFKNFTCTDGGTNCFMFYCIKWENLVFDNIKMAGDKDGVNFGPGHGAIIDNYLCESFDDGSALATIAYPSACVEVGDVYDITYRNVIDRNAVGQLSGGFFTRAVTSSWMDWTSGFTYSTGNICLNAGHLYQNHNANGWSGVGTVAPTHHSGVVTGADGVIWRYKQDATFYHADIWNITYDCCTFRKARPTFYANGWFSADTYCGGIYPGTETDSKIWGIKIINSTIKFTDEIVQSDGNLLDILIANNVIEDVTGIYINPDLYTQIFSNELNITLCGNVLRNCPSYLIYNVRENDSVIVKSSGNSYSNCVLGNSSTNSSKMRWVGIDIPLQGVAHSLNPVVGDLLRDAIGIWVYKAGGWVNLAV
jgi:hypothetical protein